MSKLSNVILLLLTMGVSDVPNFEFLEVPDRDKLVKGFEELHRLKAIDASARITEHGKRMAQLPVSVEWANLIIKSTSYGCTADVLTVVGMASADNIFFRPSDERLRDKASAAHARFRAWEGDLPSLRSVYKAWQKEAVYVPPGPDNNAAKRYKQLSRSKTSSKLSHPDWCSRNFINPRSIAKAHDVRAQISHICRKSLMMDVSTECGSDGYKSFLKCICEGLANQVAVRNVVEDAKKTSKRDYVKGQNPGGRFKTLGGGIEVNVHPNSTLFQRNPAPKAVVFTELLFTKKTYITGVTQVHESWLAEFCNHYHTS